MDTEQHPEKNYYSSLNAEWMNLGSILQMFKDSLVAMGFTYVTGVTAHTENGLTTTEY